MKKLITIVALLFVSAVTYAQQGANIIYPFTFVNPQGVVKTNDTLVNTDTTYSVFGPFTLTYDMTASYKVTQLTGTTGGNVIFQGSAGTSGALTDNWNTLICDKTQALLKDTATVSGTTSAEFVSKTYPFRFIRMRYISSGTQTSRVTGNITAKQRN